MENTPSVWKSCLKFGLIMGLISVVLSVLFYMLDLLFAPWIVIPNLILSLVVLYLLQRSYRDTYENGYITYGKAFGAGVVIFIYAAIITAIFTYLLYAVIDPGLVEKSLAATSAKLEAKGIPQSAIDAGLEMQEKMLKPWIISLSGIFFSMLSGVIMSLITSIFVAKKGNPLIDNE